MHLRPAKNQNIPCAAVQGLYWAANAAFFAFYVAFLLHNGYTDVQVGWISMLMYAATAICGPLLGYLTDMLIRPRKLIAFTLLVSVPAVLIFACVDSLPVVLACGVVISALINPMSSLIDAWFMRLKESRNELSYTLPRSAGSLLYAAAAYGVGVACTEFGYWTMFAAYIFFAGCTLLALYKCVPIECAGKNRDVSETTEANENTNLGQALAELLHCRDYVMYVAAMSLCFLGLRFTLIFQPNLVYAVGGTDAAVGACSAVAAIFEVPMMMMVKRWRGRLGPALGAVVLFVGALKPLTILLFPSVAAVILSQTLQAIFYGFMIAFSVEYIRATTPKHLYATAITVYSTMNVGVSAMIAAAAGGYLMRNGTATLLITSAGFMFAGTLVMAVSALLHRRERGRSRIAPYREDD